MIFNLQRFGGKGGTTIQSTYQPTEHELKLQKLEVDFTENHLMPGANLLADSAKTSFSAASAAVQSINLQTENFWTIGQQQIDNAFGNLQFGQTYLAESLATLDAMTDDVDIANKIWNDDIQNLNNDDLMDAKDVIAHGYEGYIDDLGKTTDKTNKNIEKLPSHLASTYEDIDFNFKEIGGLWGNATVPSDSTVKFTYNLSNISSENYKDLDKLKPTLASALNVDFDDAVKGVDKLATLGSYYNNLDSLIPEYNENYQYARYADADHSNFNDLIDGKFPVKWQTNMEESIKTTLQNTIGEVVNDLGTRGVLNSSVTTQALYDIERNASDEVAKQYQQNIQSVGGLVNNRWQVKEQGLNDQKLVWNELLGYVAQAIGLKLQAKAHEAENTRAVALALAQIFTQQFSNSSGAFTQQAGMETQKYSALNTGLNTQAQFYEQIFNNKNTEVNSQFGILAQTNAAAINWYQIMKNVADTEWTHELSELEQLRRMYQLRLQAVAAWDNTWESILANSGRKIALSAAAQEALQQPALRMWNAATGLNQSATGVLVALSNQGTRTQTQSSSGGFLGGVLSAGLTAVAGGFGSGLAGSIFGKK